MSYTAHTDTSNLDKKSNHNNHKKNLHKAYPKTCVAHKKNHNRQRAILNSIIKTRQKQKTKRKRRFLAPSAAHARGVTTPSLSKLHDIPQKKGICVASPVFCNSILRLGHPLSPLYTGVVRTRFL